MPLTDKSILNVFRLPATLAALLLLAGCEEPRFDTSSAEALQKSRQEVAENWGGDFWPRYEKAVAHLLAARQGWRRPDGKDAARVLDKIAGDSQYEGGMDEAMFRLADDLARERANKGGAPGNPIDLDIAYEFLRAELDGKSASELFEQSDKLTPEVRADFNEFRHVLIKEYEQGLKQREQDYRAFAAEAAKIKVEIFGERGVSAGLTQDLRVQNAQKVFSFRLTNNSKKPIDRIVFVRGSKEIGLAKLFHDFPAPVAPGETVEKLGLSVDADAGSLALLGSPLFMNVRFVDGSWFPKQDMERSYGEHLAMRKRSLETQMETLKDWQGSK